MPYTLEPMINAHAGPMAAILNDYIENDFSAYLTSAVPESFFISLRDAAPDYPVFVAVSDQEEVAGLGLIRPYHPSPVFARTAELTCFIHRDHVRTGLGGLFLKALSAAARNRGIDRLLASISSKNEASLAFHRKHGFETCGRLPQVGRKFGEDFDVIYMHRAV